jgi:hypothetical protein
MIDRNERERDYPNLVSSKLKASVWLQVRQAMIDANERQRDSQK